MKMKMKLKCISVFALCLLSLAGAPTASAAIITLDVSGADKRTITLTKTGANSLITIPQPTHKGFMGAAEFASSRPAPSGFAALAGFANAKTTRPQPEEVLAPCVN